MRGLLIVCALVALVSLSPSPVSAFTNGTLLPGYLCGATTGAGANADGYPKSLGGVLPYLELKTFDGGPGNFTDFFSGTRVDRPFETGTVLNTQLVLGGFHNGQNGITAFTNGIIVNITSASPTTGNTSATLPGGIIYPGYDHTIQLQSRNIATGAFDINLPLIGAIVYAQLDSNGARIGEFISTGPRMQVWPPCGPNRVGVVHNAELNEDEMGIYDGLVWRAPWNLAVGTVIHFRGAAVTDGGFGPHFTTYTVQNPTTVVPPPAPIITSRFFAGRQLNVFFTDPSRGSTWAPATTFTAVLQDTTKNTQTTFTGNASPITFDFVSALTTLTAQSGDSVTLTVSSTDNAGLSTRSAPVTWTLAAADLQTRTPTFTDLLALCDPTRQAQRTAIGVDADPDSACVYQQNFLTQSIQARLNLTATCPFAANNNNNNANTRLNTASKSASFSWLSLLFVMALPALFQL